MAKKQELDIIIKATNEASPELRRLGSQLDDVEKNANKAQKGFKSMDAAIAKAGVAFAAAAGTAALLKQGLDFAKEGIAISKVTDTFEALSQSVGATADFMERLQVATGGAVSNVQLMEGANKVLGLQLATTDTEAVKLIETAVKLGSAFGDDAATSIENFSLLLANQSIPRLDSFGISSSKVRTRMEELTTGVNAVDRETAFMIATMEEAETAMQRLGLEGEVATDDITKLEIAIGNLLDRMKVAAGAGAENFATQIGLTHFLVVVPEANKLAEENAAIVAGQVSTYGEFLDAVSLLPDEIDKLTEAEFNQIKALSDHEKRLKSIAQIETERADRQRQRAIIEGIVTRELIEQAEAVTELEARELSQSNTAQRVSQERERRAKQDAEMVQQTIAARRAEAEEGRRLFQQEVEQINAIINAREIQLGTTAARTLELGQTAEQAAAAENTLTDELLQQAAALGISATQFVLGAEATGLYTEEQIRSALAQAALEEETQRLAAAVASGEISIQSAIGTLQELEERFRGSTQSAREMASEIDRLPSSISIDVQFVGDELVLPSGVNGGVEGSRAHGGPVSAGSPYLVGEQGREIFIPNQSGTIINNTQTEQMLGGNNITINVNTPMMATPQAIANSVSNELGRRMRG